MINYKKTFLGIGISTAIIFFMGLQRLYPSNAFYLTLLYLIVTVFVLPLIFDK